jgi:RNA polymerase sigma factor (sigma-70 family)
MDPVAPNPGSAADRSPDSTVELILRARDGDGSAREALARRYMPVLRRLAHGRLPRNARSMLDTDDLVQNCMIRALSHLDEFEPRSEGAFLAFLRRILVNHLRDEIRRNRQGPRLPFDDTIPGRDRSPLEEAMGAEMLDAYEDALSQLSELQREAVILRMEYAMSYPGVARSMGGPSANAARMLVMRGIVQLAASMRGKGFET